jgi:hypothetical protein
MKFIFLFIKINLYFSYKHPYHFELDEFKVPAEHLKVSIVKKPTSLEETKFVEVYTEEQFNSMVSELRIVHELAIDLEV